jgi:hypothetical protein
MAKRTRYPGRPAGRRPGGRPTPAASAPKPTGLTSAELERAAALEAELVAREKAAIADNARRRARSRGVEVSVAGDASVPLSVRAAHEYAYVARDVRRIAITAAVMFGLLVALWLLVNVGGVAIF